MIYYVTLARKDILFFCAILESTERYAFVRTIDSQRPLLAVIGSPYYRHELEELLELIKQTIPFEIVEAVDEAC